MRKGRRIQTAYGVYRDELKRFMEDPYVAEWLGRYSTGQTKMESARDLCRFLKWLRVARGVEVTPLELLNLHLRLSSSQNIADRRRVLRWALGFTRDNPDFRGLGDKRKYNVFCVLKSFFAYHEVPLTNSKGVYGKVRKIKNKVKQISLRDVPRILGVLHERERAILLIMLQSGMSLGDVLNKFNYMWREIKPQLAFGHVKICIQDRKGNNMPYYTYFSRDAIQELRKWLIKREKWTGKPIADGEPIFITRTKKPLTIHKFISTYNYRLRKQGMKTKPLEKRSHMFRKLFKTESRPPERAIDQEIVEFMMGHSNQNNMGDVGGTYDRSPEVHERVIEGEYQKLAPYLNIYSSETSRREQGGGEQDKLYVRLNRILSDPRRWKKFEEWARNL